MNELETKPTHEIVKDLSKLEKEIELKIIKYNLLIKEMHRRFPMLENQPEFQPKVLNKHIPPFLPKK